MADEDPTAYTIRLAREKARAAAADYPCSFVLGADTTVVVNGHMLEKPTDPDDAVRMLRLLSGKSHNVITGVCLIAPADAEHARAEETRAETTTVYMAELTEREIRDYVADGEPMDKAGAYAIQGRASRWISRIEGDYFNVVGLPMALVYAMLRARNALG